jgi:hypothetical protein
MPKNWKLGKASKLKQCPYDGCDTETRNLDYHFKQDHGIPDRKEWYSVQWQRHYAGHPTQLKGVNARQTWKMDRTSN